DHRVTPPGVGRRGATVIGLAMTTAPRLFHDEGDQMGIRLSGKGAIVTGGAGGIGRAIVAAFVDEGAAVLFVDVDEEAGTAYERELTEAGHTVRFLRADISEKAAAAQIVEAAVATCGRLDVLVNNAHASRQVPLIDTTEEILALSMDTGFYATFHLMQ